VLPESTLRRCNVFKCHKPKPGKDNINDKYTGNLPNTFTHTVVLQSPPKIYAWTKKIGLGIEDSETTQRLVRQWQGRSQVLEDGTADGNTQAGCLGGVAPQKLEGYMVIAGSFVAAF